ncbi:MAG: diaminohydroxyphosphoribosylaminopyrimidine deaminase [Halieaceae bacterium]|jgi:diaminohydroxyphosphoribosylaminopyrimidine deaminase/5-amino-6-(5-phosphoribosylamino)uracil reductase
MVGSVLVCNDIIIGEGYHQKFGEPHAEVNAINSVKDKSLLSSATIYVSLEPCSHFGKTPPCADLIIRNNIPRVVIATLDSNQVVCGNGVQKLKNAGIEVVIGVLENEAIYLNKAFNTLQSTKKPFVTLKWAETSNGFIDQHRDNKNEKALQISNSSSSIWVHKLRSESDAILVGRNTVIKDNPALNTRKWFGHHPLRVIIDTHLSTIESKYKVYDQSIPTLVFNTKKSLKNGVIEYYKITDPDNLIGEILQQLGDRQIQRLLVEGGAFTHQKFIDSQQFDECFILKSTRNIATGVLSPKIKNANYAIFNLDTDKIIRHE